MSSFGIGLGSSKKGGRVADSSMLTANIKIVAQGQSDATHADNQKRQFKLSSAILNGGAYNSATLAKQNLGVSRVPCLSPFDAFASYVPSQWSINGNASNMGSNIRLVPNLGAQTGSAYYGVTAIDISRPFIIRATIVLGAHGTNPADGFAIALIDASSSANATYVGDAATSVGFIGTSPPCNGIATRVLTYTNNKADIVDTLGNRIGSQVSINAGLIAAFTAPDSFYVTLTYQNGALTWTLANVSNSATQTFGPTTIDLFGQIGSRYAFIGASAGSGGSHQAVTLTGLT